MSDRERWIIYPLLFFSLLLAARGQCNHPREAKFHRLVCHQLEILPSGSRSGRIDLFGKNNQLRVSINASGKNNAGVIEIRDAQGKKAVRLVTTDEGGLIQLVRTGDSSQLHLGYEDISGLFAIDAQGQLILLESKSGKLIPWGQPLPQRNDRQDEKIETDDG